MVTWLWWALASPAVHDLCSQVTAEFLDYTRSMGNDLSSPAPHFNFPGLKPGDRWCLCAGRWGGAAPCSISRRKAPHIRHTAADVDQQMLWQCRCCGNARRVQHVNLEGPPSCHVCMACCRLCFTSTTPQKIAGVPIVAILRQELSIVESMSGHA